MRRSDREAGRAVWAAFGVLGALIFAYFLFMLLRRTDSFSPWIDGWGVAAVEIAACLLCIWRGVGGRGRKLRLVPLVLGTGLLCWALGDVTLTIESLGGGEPPSPSVADAFYLAFFPFAYVGIALFMRGEVRSVNTPNWLDSAVAALGASAVCAAFAFHSVVHTAGGSPLAVAVDLAYPVGDLLLLGLVVGASTMLAGRNVKPWILIATGMALNTVGDTINLFGSTVGSTHTGALVNGVAWPTAILLVATAMWLPAGHSDPLSEQRPPGFALPAIASVASLAILVYATFRHPGFVAVGLAAATLAVVGVRLALSARALRALTAEKGMQAATDPLTGIGNRRYLFEVLGAYFAEHAMPSATQRRLAFLFVDLNRFKEINDAFGHPAGDQLLRQLGERFRAAIREGDVLVRLGGDEFAAILMDADGEAAVATAGRMTSALQEPFEIEAVSARVGASIGIALAPSDATDADTLIACADMAMYRAKLQGDTIALYESDFDGSGSLLRVAEELRVALVDEQLLLYYQPQLDLGTDEVLAVEALLRWQHPRLGLLAPIKFLPVAEQAGLMGELTAWVLDHALAQCAAWRAAGTAPAVSVNISATNLLDAGFTELVGKMLERHELPPSALVLEITETCLIREFEQSKTVVQDLNDLGVVVSIDDFGTGFTSMAYLSGLAARELKLDRSFITRLASEQRERDIRLVRSTVDLGHALDMRVVAEGIEDEATLQMLRELGCDVVQGYFVGKPAPPEKIDLGSGAIAAAPVAPAVVARRLTA